MRIVFMGTPQFAVSILQALLHSRHTVVGVVTAPDKPAGRGKKLTPSAVKLEAAKHNIPILQPDKLRNPEFLKVLKSWEADLFIVVAFRMLPEVVWRIPPRGTFNLHASLLPQYRGAAPINWAIVNGETETGVTTFFINDRIDEGEILLQQKVVIAPTDNAGTLHDKLMEAGATLTVNTADGLEKDTLQASAQTKPENELKMAPKIFKENLQINCRETVVKAHNHIRGMAPYPGAFVVLQNKDSAKEQNFKILAAQPGRLDQENTPGELFISVDKRLFLGFSNGWIEILEGQLPGKKRLKARDILNGNALNASWTAVLKP